MMFYRLVHTFNSKEVKYSQEENVMQLFLTT